MRKFLAGLFLAGAGFLFLSSPALAGGGIVPVFGYQTAVSSITLVVVTVSTSVGTQVDNPQMANRVALEIQNIDTTANLWCVPVSSAAIAVNAGRKIAAGNSWIVSTMDTFQGVSFSTTTGRATNTSASAPFYCLSDGAASTKAAVTQLY